MNRKATEHGIEDCGCETRVFERLAHMWSRVEITHNDDGFTVRAYDDNKHKPTGKPLSYVAQLGTGDTLHGAAIACIADQDDTRLDEAIRRADAEAVKLVTDEAERTLRIRQLETGLQKIYDLRASLENEASQGPETVFYLKALNRCANIARETLGITEQNTDADNSL